MEKFNTIADGEINIINHVRCDNGKDKITVGIMDDGNYLLHLGDETLPSVYRTLFIPEEALMTLTATIITYFKHYKIDFPKKITEYLDGNPLAYTFSSNEDV